MPRYRLPDVLGGGEFEAVALNDSGQYAGFDFPGFGFNRLWLPLQVLTVVEPPLPPEPPAGSVVLDKDGDAWQLHPSDDDWHIALGTDHRSWAGLNACFGPLRWLVPASAGLVDLPWKGRYIGVELTEHGDIAVRITTSDGITHLTHAEAAELVRALSAAAHYRLGAI